MDPRRLGEEGFYRPDRPGGLTSSVLLEVLSRGGLLQGRSNGRGSLEGPGKGRGTWDVVPETVRWQGRQGTFPEMEEISNVVGQGNMETIGVYTKDYTKHQQHIDDIREIF